MTCIMTCHDLGFSDSTPVGTKTGFKSVTFRFIDYCTRNHVATRNSYATLQTPRLTMAHSALLPECGALSGGGNVTHIDYILLSVLMVCHLLFSRMFSRRSI